MLESHKHGLLSVVRDARRYQQVMDVHSFGVNQNMSCEITVEKNRAKQSISKNSRPRIQLTGGAWLRTSQAIFGFVSE